MFGAWRHTVQMEFIFATKEAMQKFDGTLPDYFRFAGLTFNVSQREQCYPDRPHTWRMFVTGTTETTKHHDIHA